MSEAALRVLPPRAATRLAIVVVGVLVGVAVPAGLLLGAGTGVAAALGGVSVLLAALREGPWWRPVSLGLTTAAFASLAAVSTDRPLLLAFAVAGAVLAAAPTVLALGPVLSASPVVVAAAGTEAATAGPLAIGLGAAIGAVAVTVVIRGVIGVRLPPTRLRPGVAWTYVVSLAVGAGAAIGVATALDVGHALWIVVALSAVLVPAASETLRHATARVVGTIVGALVGTGVATVLPGWGLAAVAVPALVLGVGWAIGGSQSRGSGWTAAAVVLLAAAIERDAAWETALERAGLTGVGVGVAVALALVVARAETRSDRAQPPTG